MKALSPLSNGYRDGIVGFPRGHGAPVADRARRQYMRGWIQGLHARPKFWSLVRRKIEREVKMREKWLGTES